MTLGSSEKGIPRGVVHSLHSNLPKDLVFCAKTALLEAQQCSYVSAQDKFFGLCWDVERCLLPQLFALWWQGVEPCFLPGAAGLVLAQNPYLSFNAV